MVKLYRVQNEMFDLVEFFEFDYKNGSGHQIGFIAQEIQEVYPDTVGEDSEGYLTVTGWSKTESRLVKAIQELKAENDLLKSRIEILENK